MSVRGPANETPGNWIRAAIILFFSSRSFQNIREVYRELEKNSKKPRKALTEMRLYRFVWQIGSNHTAR